MEPAAIEGYVEDVITSLRAPLLARARSWERLGLVAPPPDELAQMIIDRWLASRGGA